MESFAESWLRLREPYDRAARSAPLARGFLAALPANPRVLDLGAGTGANARYLASLRRPPVRWVLADADAAILDAATVPNACIERRRMDLSTPQSLTAAGRIDGIAASAFADLASAAWVERLSAFAALRRLPVLVALTVDGRVSWLPEDPVDRDILRRFRRDQSRDKGFGPALGPRAPWRLADALRRRGYAVDIARSDWCLGSGNAEMLNELVDGFAAAGHASPDWRDRRRAQIEAGALSLRIGHLDVLARRRRRIRRDFR